MSATPIDFPPFQLDLGRGKLRRDGALIPLRPKTFAVLQHLVERAGELVTKLELLDAVWPGIAVGDDVVRISVGELRVTFGDARATPRFIETVPRHGYRFIAKLGDTPPASSTLPAASELPPTDDLDDLDNLVVGRTHERAQIAEWMKVAATGRRQLVFVTGEAGIGKTTLVDAAIRDLHRSGTTDPHRSGTTDPHRSGTTKFRVARGQCIEQYGGGEPYKPVLEALGSLCRGADGPATLATLQRRAPHWVLDVLAPARSSDGNLAAGAQPAAGAEHTLHMLADSLTALAADSVLVLLFEDVHWIDLSTLDLLSSLAQSREPARLLVLCTMRAADAIAHRHPLVAMKRELVRKGQGHEMALGGLASADVAEYLASRFPGADLPRELLPLLVERSDGSPFFVVTVLDHLLASKQLVDDGSGWRLRGSAADLRTSIPDGLRAVIEPRLERLTAEELRVLEAASVAGLEFAAHAVAAAAPTDSPLADIETVEALCDGLALRQEILRVHGESVWPDGTTSARYAFRHALYQQVLDQRLATSLRRRLHQQIGERLESGYGARTAEVASELAGHFERSGDGARAVRYHAEAAAHARARFSHQETRLHVEAALALLREQPETSHGLQQRLPMLADLGWASFVARGWGDEGGARAFAQMREIAERLDGAEARFKAMEGELIVHTMRAEYASARRRGDEMLDLAGQVGSRNAVVGALPPIGAVLMHVGEIAAAQAIAERSRALGDPSEPSIQSVSSCNLLASAFAYQGRIAEARAMNREAVSLGTKSDVPFIRAQAATYAATIDHWLHDVPSARTRATEAEAIAREFGFEVLGSLSTLYRAWCDVQDGRAEAIAEMRGAFDGYVASGQRISTSSYGVVVAETYLEAGDVTKANAMLELIAAFVAETGEQIVAHELHRLQGEARLVGGPTSRRTAEAVACFERAIAIAEAQGALFFELRATMSLHRVQPRSARPRLARLVARFGAEDDAPVIRNAAALLGL